VDGRDPVPLGGILRVAEIVADHGHAVRRDLLSLGLHERDIGTPACDLGEFVSLILASPPNSAVRYAAEGGWSQTDLLLAQRNEQTLGVHYERPGVASAPQSNRVPIVGGIPQMTPQTIADFQRRRARDMARADELAATEKKLA
jgi:hypothetical protein